MSTSRIKMGHAYGETPPNAFSDFEWIRQHEKELLAQHGECSIIVYQQKVIGTGATYEAALQDAERNLPANVDNITPVHERLRNRKTFLITGLVRKKDAAQQ